MSQTTTPLISVSDLQKTYHRGSEQIHAVDGITLDVHEHDYLAFVGPSGSGKTTLLHLLGCLDNPTGGTLKVSDRLIYGKDISMNERDLTKLRRELYGYVFQKFYLIPTLTVEENILLPFAFYCKPCAHKDAKHLANLLGISHRLSHLPRELSGGEMQRVAIARALINKPQILLADEPTGNLDSRNGQAVIELLAELNRRFGRTIILATHSTLADHCATLRLCLRDGRITEAPGCDA